MAKKTQHPPHYKKIFNIHYVHLSKFWREDQEWEKNKIKKIKRDRYKLKKKEERENERKEMIQFTLSDPLFIFVSSLTFLFLSFSFNYYRIAKGMNSFWVLQSCAEN